MNYTGNAGSHNGGQKRIKGREKEMDIIDEIKSKMATIIEKRDCTDFCIDTLKENKGQIVTWSWLDNGNIVKKADNFEEYFIEKLEDYI